MDDRQPSEGEIFDKSDFGQDFIWGVAAAAFQIEGSPSSGGKGPSIWDTFSGKKGKIYKNESANVACDFYNRYGQDLDLMKAMNIPNFRFSLSWSRIIPDGSGSPNQQGIDFYDRVIDKCLELGIEPWVTLYHWDLPEALEKKGGWTNRDIVDWFKAYASLCAEKFGDRVKYWMVLNEPMVFVGAGHFLGVHAPGRKGVKNFLPALHHATLCQAEGGRVLREKLPDAQIGTTFSCSHIDPYRDNEKDRLAARRVDALLNRLFVEPALGLGYPLKELEFLKGLEKFIRPGDRDLMEFGFDFIGVQNYTREVVKYSWLVPYLRAVHVKAVKRKVPVTAMEWEVYPESIYRMLKKFGAYEGIGKLYVTENGAAFPDTLADGEVKDPERLEYIKNYMGQVLRAKKEGVDVNGYYVWSFTDNFEWAEGYHPRFGLVHIDYKTQQRIIKSSGKWFRDFLKEPTPSMLKS